MKARVSWIEDKTFMGEDEGGHGLVISSGADAKPKPGPSPMELILMGTGGCTMYDVVTILIKSRQDFTNVEVKMDATRRETAPRVFTRIHMHFVVTGRNLSEKRVARAIELSAEKYCSATMMLRNSAEITHDFEIVELAD